MAKESSIVPCTSKWVTKTFMSKDKSSILPYKLYKIVGDASNQRQVIGKYECSLSFNYKTNARQQKFMPAQHLNHDATE